MKLYGVSSGNGNDGVSHMFADYYVRTDDPYRLAELALLAQFKPERMAWAKDVAVIDGEVDYTISATIFDPPDDEKDHNGCPEEWASDQEDQSDNSWSDTNGAWMIVEVFPDDDPREGRPIYDTIEECFAAPELALVPAQS